MKTRWPTVMGLDAPGPGNAVFHARFCVFDQSVGTEAESLETPDPFGPRNCIHDSAALPAEHSIIAAVKHRKRIESSSKGDHAVAVVIPLLPMWDDREVLRCDRP